MSVETKDGTVYVDFPGYALASLLAFIEATGAVVEEALALRRSMMKQYGDFE